MSLYNVFMLLLFLGTFRLFLSLLWRGIDILIYIIQCIDLKCPSCQKELKCVHYICNQCGKYHTDLHPTIDYIFFRRCDCGRLLPTTRLFGREKLRSVCPKCHTELVRGGDESQVFAFPILGGKYSGKKGFTMALLSAFLSKLSPQKGWQIEYSSYEDGVFASDMQKCIEQGIEPKNAGVKIPPVFSCELKSGISSGNKKFCLFNSGLDDVITSEERKTIHFVDGLIILIDPFMFPCVRNRYRNQYKGPDSFTVCGDPIDDYFSLIQNQLSNTGLSWETSITKLPCAIIFTKTDSFDLDRFIGNAAIKSMMVRYPNIDYEQAEDAVCRFYLKKWGGASFLSKIESVFGCSRCFSVSSFGHIPSVSRLPFVPQRVLPPLEWLLSQIQTDARLSNWVTFIVILIITSIPILFFSLLALVL